MDRSFSPERCGRMRAVIDGGIDRATRERASEEDGKEGIQGDTGSVAERFHNPKVAFGEVQAPAIGDFCPCWLGEPSRPALPTRTAMVVQHAAIRIAQPLRATCPVARRCTTRALPRKNSNSLGRARRAPRLGLFLPAGDRSCSESAQARGASYRGEGGQCAPPLPSWTTAKLLSMSESAL